jgi:Na+-driven multidrug efflux pump
MGTMGLTFFLMPQFFTSLFTNDAEVIISSAGVLRIVGLAQPFLALTMVLGGALRGAGDTRAVLAITVLGVTTARIGVAYTLVRLGFGLVGAWIGMAVDLAVRGSLLLFRFKRGSWKHLRV